MGCTCEKSTKVKEFKKNENKEVEIDNIEDNKKEGLKNENILDLNKYTKNEINVEFNNSFKNKETLEKNDIIRVKNKISNKSQNNIKEKNNSENSKKIITELEQINKDKSEKIKEKEYKEINENEIIEYNKDNKEEVNNKKYKINDIIQKEKNNEKEDKINYPINKENKNNYDNTFKENNTIIEEEIKLKEKEEEKESNNKPQINNNSINEIQNIINNKNETNEEKTEQKDENKIIIDNQKKLENNQENDIDKNQNIKKIDNDIIKYEEINKPKNEEKKIKEEKREEINENKDISEEKLEQIKNEEKNINNKIIDKEKIIKEDSLKNIENKSLELKEKDITNKNDDNLEEEKICQSEIKTNNEKNNKEIELKEIVEQDKKNNDENVKKKEKETKNINNNDNINNKEENKNDEINLNNENENIQKDKREKDNNIIIFEDEKNNDMKEDDEIITSHINEEILEKLDRNKLIEIVKKAPNRLKSKLNDLIIYLKKVTNKMNEFEKAYIIFYWLHENIEYDIVGLKTGKAEHRPVEIYTIGKCVCMGYSILFEFIGDQLGLKVYYITGVALNTDYEDKYERHAWNVLEVNKIYYIIDSTWGSGYATDDKYTKKLKEFYFCSNPEYFIFTHFPIESKWQLLKSPIKSEDFEKMIKIRYNFFEYFKGLSDIYKLIITKNEYTFRLYKRYSNIKVIVNILICRNHIYTSKNNCEKIITNNEKYIDIKCIFTEINDYQVLISVKNNESNIYNEVIKYEIKYMDESEYQFLYGDINNKNNKEIKPIEHDEIIANLNKNKIYSIINKAPSRKNSTLNTFINYLKNETKDLDDFEKAYTLFYWIYKNISYGFCELYEDDYENIYKKEKLNILFSKMYSYILKNIGLNVYITDGFCKNDPEYNYQDIIIGTNNSWNILEVKGCYYLIYSTIYLLNIKDNDNLLDFYFCSKPEQFIWNFFPKFKKWQLLENPITKDEFQRRVKLNHNFFNYFNSIEPSYSYLDVENRCNIKIYKKNNQNKILGVILGLKNNKNKYVKSQSYLENLNCKCMVIDNEDYKDIKCVFKTKGKYLLKISANEGESRSYREIAEIHIECSNCTKDHKYDFLPEDYKKRNIIKNEEPYNNFGNPFNRIGAFGGIGIMRRENYNVG